MSNDFLCEIKENAVTVKDKSGKTFDIATDSVILSVGYKPAPIAPKAKNIKITISTTFTFIISILIIL